MAMGERRFGDEFLLTPAESAKLPVEWRDAHIAKLIADVALFWRDLDRVLRTDYELPIGTVAAEPEVTA